MTLTSAVAATSVVGSARMPSPSRPPPPPPPSRPPEHSGPETRREQRAGPAPNAALSRNTIPTTRGSCPLPRRRREFPSPHFFVPSRRSTGRFIRRRSLARRTGAEEGLAAADDDDTGSPPSPRYDDLCAPPSLSFFVSPSLPLASFPASFVGFSPIFFVPKFSPSLRRRRHQHSKAYVRDTHVLVCVCCICRTIFLRRQDRRNSPSFYPFERFAWTQRRIDLDI